MHQLKLFHGLTGASAVGRSSLPVHKVYSARECHSNMGLLTPSTGRHTGRKQILR